ncbi:unnamed protein product [Ostreobium quekettii]|uniref:DNA-directed RNA polymerase III subunit RPC9 n=1 Tax=Ostreobium quekettii TaxID=121088 RepID=A0A8S1IN53_9CHLO|nr:unnamed protein product [Ostreobium quekettii]
MAGTGTITSISAFFDRHRTACFLRQVLHERGAGDAKVGKARDSEIEVFKYLSTHSAGLRSREQIQNICEALKPFDLTQPEILQLVNLRPTNIVEIHLIVQECEARLDEARIEELLLIVKQHLGP